MTRLIEPHDDGTIRQRTFVCFILDASRSMEEHKAQVLSGYREYVETLQLALQKLQQTDFLAEPAQKSRQDSTLSLRPIVTRWVSLDG